MVVQKRLVMPEKASKNNSEAKAKIALSNILSEIEHQFHAIVGNTYYLYCRDNNSFFISMVEPEFWNMERAKITFVSETIYTQDNNWRRK